VREAYSVSAADDRRLPAEMTNFIELQLSTLRADAPKARAKLNGC
jgi:hypothetical protein